MNKQKKTEPTYRRLIHTQRQIGQINIGGGLIPERFQTRRERLLGNGRLIPKP